MAKGAAEKLPQKPLPQEARQQLSLVLPAPALRMSPPRLQPKSETNATTGQIVIEIGTGTGIVTGTATVTDAAPMAAAEAVAAAAVATTAVGNHHGRTTTPADGEAETDADDDRRTTRPVTLLTRVRPAAAVIGDATAKGSATR